jgi:hypothetical protein
MCDELYQFIPTELIYEIEKQLLYSYKRDVVNDIKKISGFIKRNTEDSYYKWFVDFATGRKTMWEECHSDEQLLEYYPQRFIGGITKENLEKMYSIMNRWYDDSVFDGSYGYNEFRLGDWEVEPFWW